MRPLVLSILFLILICCASARAQEQQSALQHLVWAQRFLRAFYPELIDHKYRMTTTAYLGFDESVGDFGRFDISIGQAAPGTIMGIMGVGQIGPNPPKGVKPGPVYAEQFLTANFAFFKTGNLFMFSCGGSAAGNPAAYDSVKQLVEWHPEWTEERAIAELTKAGAVFGPGEKEKFLSMLPVARLEESFGKITIVSTEFESLLEEHNSPFALLHWLVKVKVNDPDGSDRMYDMIFEPFKAKLIQIQAVSP
jgi:hypothetical protein